MVPAELPQTHRDPLSKIKPNPYPGTQSVLRAISLLKTFSDEQPEWHLSALADTVGLNKTTAYRLLTALISQGLVARDPGSNTYRLGPEIVVLGGRALRSNDLRSLSQPELKALAAIVGETATLEIMAGHETIILDEVAGEHLMSGSQTIGTRWPAYATSTGKAMMAYMDAQELERVIPTPIPLLTPKSITTREALHHALATVRQEGFAVADEELELGLIAVGAALRDYDGKAVAAISLAGPAMRLTPDRIPGVGALVREAALRISAQLGFQSDLPGAASE